MRLFNRSILAAGLLVLTFFSAGFAQQIAFPGAEGNGKFATGGRGGEVYAVTNLNDAGAGSLRDAVSKGNRTIIFKVSGNIALKSELIITQSNITLAGQTAPGDGICIKDRKVMIKDAKNIVIRYMKFRIGDTYKTNVDDQDALSVWGGSNIMIDHCSFGWSIDAVLDMTHQSGQITVQWSLVAEALYDSYHTKGPHSMGSGIDGSPMPTSYHHNILASSNSRMPRIDAFDGVSKVDFVNNVVYNWGNESSYGGENSNVNWVNNYYKPGPSTAAGVKSRLFHCENAGTKMYLSGNYMFGNAAVTADNKKGITFEGACTQASMLVPARFNISNVTTQTALEAYTSVLANAGSTIPGRARDKIDQRIVNDIKNGTGKIIDSQTEVGGWPALASLAAPLDTDKDGMPDAWEKSKNLNPADALDGKKVTATGYTNLELYLNSLTVAAVVIPQPISSSSVIASSSSVVKPLSSSSVIKPISSSSSVAVTPSSSSAAIVGPVANLRVLPNPVIQVGDMYYTWTTKTPPSIVNFTVMDIRGTIVRKFDQQNVVAGNNQVWIKDSHQLLSGNYVVRLAVAGKTIASAPFTKK